jgi:hypothetical protein
VRQQPDTAKASRSTDSAGANLTHWASPPSEQAGRPTVPLRSISVLERWCYIFGIRRSTDATRRKTSKGPIHDTWDFLAFFSAIIFLPWTSVSAGPSSYPPRKVDCTRICWLADHTHKETRTLSFPEEIILRMHITQRGPASDPPRNLISTR